MPFGLKNARTTNQRDVTTILRDMIHKKVEVYVDDMIVKSKEREGHYTALKKFFQRIREFWFWLNPQKCTFSVTAGKMLGVSDYIERYQSRPFQNQGHLRNATTKD